MIRLLLQLFQGLDHQVGRLVHADRFNMEFESVLYFPQVNDVLEFIMSDAFSASGALSHIANDSPAITLAEILDIEDTRGAKGFKLMGILV